MLCKHLLLIHVLTWTGHVKNYTSKQPNKLTFVRTSTKKKEKGIVIELTYIDFDAVFLLLKVLLKLVFQTLKNLSKLFKFWYNKLGDEELLCISTSFGVLREPESWLNYITKNQHIPSRDHSCNGCDVLHERDH